MPVTKRRRHAFLFASVACALAATPPDGSGQDAGAGARATTLIVAEHKWKEVAQPTAFDDPSPVGTGPFTEVRRFEPNVYELGRNAKYWQKDKLGVSVLRVPPRGCIRTTSGASRRQATLAAGADAARSGRRSFRPGRGLSS